VRKHFLLLSVFDSTEGIQSFVDSRIAFGTLPNRIDSRESLLSRLHRHGVEGSGGTTDPPPIGVLFSTTKKVKLD